jgi:hypothetical protein
VVTGARRELRLAWCRIPDFSVLALPPRCQQNAKEKSIRNEREEELSMLTVPQLAQIKGRDPYLYESLTQVVGAVNALGRATGVDPAGSIAAPDPIGGLSVAAADGIFDIALTDNSPVRKGIFYFVESDTTSAFAAPHVYFLGSSRNLRVSIGNQTLYWRAYSQYIGSVPSPPVAFGTPPSAVTGGGLAGPPLQPSSGSGTASGKQGGSGFGIDQTLAINDTLS